MICPKCGKELKDGVNFCSKCGASFEQKKKKNYALLVVALLSVLIMVGVLLFLVLKPSGEEDGDNGEEFVAVDDRENEETENDKSENDNPIDADDMMNRPMADTEFSGNTLANLHNGGDVVSDGENVYFYELGRIYQLDKEGNVNELYRMSDENALRDSIGWTWLQIQDGVLYFKDDYRVVAYDLSTRQAKYLMDAVASFVVDGEYIYYITKENYEAQQGYLYGATIVGKYSFAEGIPVERLTLEEKWDGAYIFGKSPTKDGEILIAKEEYVYPENERADGKTIIAIASTDVKSVKNEYDMEICPSYGGVDYYENVKAKDYAYILQTPIDSEGYEREFGIPEIISADDMQNTLDKLETKYAQYIKDYYIKYDINNWRQRDEEKKETLLEEYPIIAERVIYLLSPATKNNQKLMFEEVFAEAGVTEDLMAKSKEMGGNKPIPKEPAYLKCINLQTMKEEYNIREEMYLYHVFGCYENDLIVYAYINEVAGVYRLTEKNLWECGLNGQALQPQLILEVPLYITGMHKHNMEIYVVDEYLYYRYEGVENQFEGTHAYLGGRMQRIALNGTGVLGVESCGEVLTENLYQ